MRKKLKDDLEKTLYILQWRTKEVDSFAKKIVRPEKGYECFEDITDLSALRVLTYTLGETERVRESIEKEFDVDWSKTDDKGKQLKTSELGYRSINYIVRLPDSSSSPLEWAEFASLEAEIQVDTILSHVWSEIQHPIYKKEMTVPPELERRLYLVRGLLEVADLELQDFKEKTKELSSRIDDELRKKSPVRISTFALPHYLEHSELVQQLVHLASEIGFDLMSSLEQQLSIITDLADACLLVKIRTTDQLEDFLGRNLAQARNFLRELYVEIGKEKEAPWSVGEAYLVLFLLAAAFPESLNRDFFVKRGWSSTTVNLIKKARLS